MLLEVDCASCPFCSCQFCGHRSICRYAFARDAATCEHFECIVRCCDIDSIMLITASERVHELLSVTLKCNALMTYSERNIHIIVARGVDWTSAFTLLRPLRSAVAVRVL